MIELLTSPEAWISLLVLSVMEIVLGIDNIVFITILTGRLPRDRQLLARRLGIGAALFSRIALLASINWVMHLEDELFTFIIPWNGKDIILAGGGLFLLYKATKEIFEAVEHPEDHGPEGADDEKPAAASMFAVVFQIMLLDIVFSLDSVITAVGMAEDIRIMVAAVLCAVVVMLAFAGPVGDFVQDNPSVRVLALAFLVLIGVMLMMEATGQEVSKAYIYAAMGFSLFVQILNLRMDRRKKALRKAARDAGTHAPA
jgi:predicted tellurium resistance membrane protein TerC